MTPDGPRLEAVREALGRHRLVEGWGTVELERAVAGVAAGGSATPAPDDELLGARCVLVRVDGLAEALVLLEPSTEGLLAATLARHGEGLAVTYLLAEGDAVDRLRGAGVALSREAESPLGRARLVLGGERWGPHIAVVRGTGGAGEPGGGGAPPATIG